MRQTFGITLTTAALLFGGAGVANATAPRARSRHQLRRRWPQTPRITTATRPDCGAWQGFLVCSDSLG